MAEYDEEFAETYTAETLTRIKEVFGVKEITPEQKAELFKILDDYFDYECSNRCGEVW